MCHCGLCRQGISFATKQANQIVTLSFDQYLIIRTGKNFICRVNGLYAKYKFPIPFGVPGTVYFWCQFQGKYLYDGNCLYQKEKDSYKYALYDFHTILLYMNVAQYLHYLIHQHYLEQWENVQFNKILISFKVLSEISHYTSKDIFHYTIFL